MRRGIGITAAWMAATFVAILIAAAAVASVRTEVTDTPTALGEPAIVAVAIEPEPDEVDQLVSSVSIVETTTTTVSPTVEAETTSTTAQVDTPTTTTTNPPAAAASSTTTSTTNASYTKTYDTEAGSVRVTVSGDSVSFSGATPLPGWKVELENSGPEEVKVHFERNDDEGEEIEFKAKVEDGELEVSISGSDDD
ncbi:MAG: hypothetical protein M3112_05995 [Actinomycetia bacterium]|nr:hypothetical protein [Actinomycetes bacterium]